MPPPPAVASSGPTPASKRTRARANKPSLRDETPTTTQALSPRERDKQQDRINRKRVQNRISQQAIRERQAAHQKQFETLQTIIDTSLSTESGSDASSQISVLGQHLSLLEENRELREALLRMRKKLLSLNSATAAIADDKIFEQLLRKKPNKSAQAKDGPVGSKAAGGSESESGARIPPNDNANNGAEVETQQTPLGLGGVVVSPARHVEDDQQQSGASSDGSTVSLPALPASDSRRDLLSCHSSNYWEQGAASAHSQHGAASTEFSTSESFALADINMLDWSMFPSNPGGIVHPVELFQDPTPPKYHLFDISCGKTWTVEEACLWYLARELGIGEVTGLVPVPQNERSQYDTLRAAIASTDVSEQLVADVAKIGLEMMAKDAGFSDYIYGVGANDVMEKILRFRLSPTPQNRAAIPEPFSPTPLQLMNTNYPISIDWLNWPSIRDQCIFKAGSFDLSRLCAEIVANTVVEISEFRTAINTHDTFFTRVFQNAGNSEFPG